MSDTPFADGRLVHGWLSPLVERFDWGYDDRRRGRPVRLMTADEFEGVIRGERFPRQRLGPKLLASHLAGRDRLHAVPRWSSGRWFGMVDIDAHHGEPDAPAAAAFIAERHFRGAYAEPSRRGHHVYVVAETGGASGRAWNDRLGRMREGLRASLASRGFRSTVEVCGTFTVTTADRRVESMGQMFALPTLPGGRADLSRLLASPVFPPDAIDRAGHAAQSLSRSPLGSVGDGLAEASADRLIHYLRRMVGQSGDVVGRVGASVGSENAWERMRVACWTFTVRHRALPSLDELLDWYATLHPAAGPEDDERRRRAAYAIDYRSRTFDPDKARGGLHYSNERDLLLAAVREHCRDRGGTRYPHGLDDESLAVALHVVTAGSFARADRPDRQWGCPHASFAAMFESLRSAGVVSVGGGNRNKVVALKLVLQRAGLIECIDADYVPGGPRDGIGKKYHVGPRHWRYAEFCRFAEGVPVQYVRGPAAASRCDRSEVPS